MLLLRPQKNLPPDQAHPALRVHGKLVTRVAQRLAWFAYLHAGELDRSHVMHKGFRSTARELTTVECQLHEL